MADNTVQNGTDTIATDDLTTLNGGAVSGFKAQRVKVGHGVDGTFTDVTPSAGLPVFPTTTSTTGITSVAATAASTTLLAANAARKTAAIYNGTNVDILVALSATAASSVFYTIRVLAGGYYELPGQNIVYTGQVNLLGVAAGTLSSTAASTGTVLVTEIT